MTEMHFSDGGHVGAKPPISAPTAVAATQHPLVTEAILDVIAGGGNAADAAVAGCLLQATVQQSMTNHGGMITFLYWEASTGRTYALNSHGTHVPDLAPFRPVAPSAGSYATSQASTPCGMIPGFMPGLKALHERLGTRPWAELCEPAISAAEEGHILDPWDAMHLSGTVGFWLQSRSGREYFTPDGYLPQAGDLWRKPELARTLRLLADEGPDCFTTGTWGRWFVERANAMGWPIEQKHMTAIPPRWGEPLRFSHRGHEIVQLPPPEVIGLRSAIMLGILDELDVASMGHYTESAEALYYVAHALRRAIYETGIVNDPLIFDDPTEHLLSREFHVMLADILRRSRPKVDLTNHVRMFAGAGNPVRDARVASIGSCELSIVDAEGNWIQLMNTLQSGGIPGEVVGGVPMIGSSAQPHLDAFIGAWFTGGGRVRAPIGNTLVMKDGAPVWALGTPTSPNETVPQVLLNRLQYGMDPYAAEDAPRILQLSNAYSIPIEARIADSVILDLAKLGLSVDLMQGYTTMMGSYQMCWRDDDGTLRASAGPRFAGNAGGF
jgi:gamma-glutamyltranspeptidase/glutathione hydrolase